MISIDNNKQKCCGCTACMNICPVKAIQMEEDEEGFLYPKIDIEKCIKCNQCEKVCPVKNPKVNKEVSKAYVVRTKDKEILKTSTSGGFFTPLAKYVLNQDGTIIGVTFGENLRVEHIKVDKSNIEKLKLLRESKYMQSYLGSIFQEVKNLLQSNKLVLFTGTACQVQGLKNFLNKEYENLITMDLICRGVPSPKLWRMYIEYQEKKNNSKIKEVHFRNKTYGYHSSTMKLVFENNKKYYGSARVDYMLKSFFTDICTRPSCYECAFKTKRHISDFTVFDSWHAKELAKGLKEDDRGYTNVFVNTKKAANLLKNIENELYIYQTDLDKAITLDGPMVENSIIPNKNRNEFFTTLNEQGIEKTMKKYIKVSLKDKLIEKSKKYVYRTKMNKK